MARITVEDCLEKLDSRFELVMAATQRSRQILLGGLDARVPWENDKAPVVALREIAEGVIDPKQLDELARERAQELQAAEAGVSDSFIAGTTPASQATTPTPTSLPPVSVAPPSETTSSRLHTLSSRPSLFEQVASQPGPVKIIDEKPVAADHIDAPTAQTLKPIDKEIMSLSEAIARKEAEDKHKQAMDEQANETGNNVDQPNDDESSDNE